MVRILIVDAREDFLRDLKRVSSERDLAWSFVYAPTAEEALDAAKLEPFDVLLANMDAQNMRPDVFLRRITDRSPSMVRILLSGDGQETAEISGLAHQSLSKNEGSEALLTAVQKALKLRRELNAPELVAAIHRMKTLPTLPRAYIEITGILRKDDYHQGELIRVLNEDLALGTAVLKVANSAFYAGAMKVSSLPAAVTILGTNAIKNVVFFAGLVSKFDERAVPDFDLDEMWRHSVAVANNALALARHFRMKQEAADEAFSAGLVHDIGKLIFLKTMRKEFQRALEIAEDEAVPLHEAEAWVFGAGHEEVGAYLLQLWGLPDGVVEAVMYHHHALEAVCKTRTALSLICVANEIDHRQRAGNDFDLEEFEFQLRSISDNNTWVGLAQAFI